MGDGGPIAAIELVELGVEQRTVPRLGEADRDGRDIAGEGDELVRVVFDDGEAIDLTRQLELTDPVFATGPLGYDIGGAGEIDGVLQVAEVTLQPDFGCLPVVIRPGGREDDAVLLGQLPEGGTGAFDDAGGPQSFARIDVAAVDVVEALTV